MTGRIPNTEWLKDCLALDNKGFIITGQDLRNGQRRWIEVARAPPSLFAGDEPARCVCGR